MKNTKVTFTYRDGANYKNDSGPYVLEGQLKASKRQSLEDTFGDAGSLMIPHQIHPDFKNACPSLKGQDSTNNGGSFDDEFDHPYHGLIVEETDEEADCAISAKDFYKKINSTDFDEFDY